MTYQDLVRELWALGHGKGMRPGLDRIRAASERLGDPAQEYPAVHVAGTNGKGSTCHMVAGILEAHGLRVGLTTSPHLHRLTERIRVDGGEVGREELAEIATDVRGRLGGWDAFDLTFFEVVTLLAFEVFRRSAVDAAVVEVGMGGRLDATQLCRSFVSAITTIGLDHTEHLGPTIEAIAAEKAGILRTGVPVVLGRIDAAAREVIAARAWELRAPVVNPFDKSLELEEPPLPGEHQRDNAAVAMASARLHLLRMRRRSDPALLRPAPFVLPGRLEYVDGDPPVLFDVAHNPEGARSLAACLRERAPAARLVLGTLEHKDLGGILEALRIPGRKLHACAPAMPHATPAERVAAAWGEGAAVHGTVAEAFDAAREAARDAGETVVVTGSHYVVCDARARRLGITDIDGPMGL